MLNDLSEDDTVERVLIRMRAHKNSRGAVFEISLPTTASSITTMPTPRARQSLSTFATDLAGCAARGLRLVFRWNGSHRDTVRASANRWHLARGDVGWAVTRRENALLDGDAAAWALLAG